jgi:hypothetical protein
MVYYTIIIKGGLPMNLNAKTSQGIGYVKCKIALLLIFLSYLWLSTYWTYCSDIFSTATTVVDNTKSGVIDVATSLFPLALAICVLCLFITHDEKKLGIELKILITLCVGYLILLMIKNGTITSTLDGLITKQTFITNTMTS